MVEMYKHGKNDGPEEQEDEAAAVKKKKKKAEAVRSVKRAQPKAEEPGQPRRQLPEIQLDKTSSTTKSKKSQLASLNFALQNMVDMYQNG